MHTSTQPDGNIQDIDNLLFYLFIGCLASKIRYRDLKNTRLHMRLYKLKPDYSPFLL